MNKKNPIPTQRKMTNTARFIKNKEHLLFY
jgi:hypothetical protein